jgi:hypothetical protein
MSDDDNVFDLEDLNSILDHRKTGQVRVVDTVCNIAVDWSATLSDNKHRNQGKGHCSRISPKTSPGINPTI